MRPIFRLVPVGIVLALVVADLPAQAIEARNGTWELNLAKSKYSPGTAPKSVTRTYQIVGSSVKYSSKGIDGAGMPTLVEYAADFGGKYYPITGSADSDTISLKRIDSHKFQSTQKRAGKVVIKTTNMISQDGKVMTVTSKGTNAKRQPFNSVAVFEKQ
jgi:hypothetical protein